MGIRRRKLYNLDEMDSTALPSLCPTLDRTDPPTSSTGEGVVVRGSSTGGKPTRRMWFKSHTNPLCPPTSELPGSWYLSRTGSLNLV